MKKPSERIYQIRKGVVQAETAGGEALALLLAVMDYLDEEYARTEKNHCACHACPNYTPSIS